MQWYSDVMQWYNSAPISRWYSLCSISRVLHWIMRSVFSEHWLFIATQRRVSASTETECSDPRWQSLSLRLPGANGIPRVSLLRYSSRKKGFWLNGTKQFKQSEWLAGLWQARYISMLCTQCCEHLAFLFLALKCAAHPTRTLLFWLWAKKRPKTFQIYMSFPDECSVR